MFLKTKKNLKGFDRVAVGGICSDFLSKLLKWCMLLKYFREFFPPLPLLSSSQIMDLLSHYFQFQELLISVKIRENFRFLHTFTTCSDLLQYLLAIFFSMLIPYSFTFFSPLRLFNHEKDCKIEKNYFGKNH